MRKTIDPEAPKICDACKIRDDDRKKGEKKVSNKTKILIECDPHTQAEVEEYCMIIGKNFSEYFLDLHEKRKISELSIMLNNPTYQSTELLENPTLEDKSEKIDGRRKPKNKIW
jgi:hypothetical protein